MNIESAPAAAACAPAEEQPGSVGMPCQPYPPIENVQAARLPAAAASSTMRVSRLARADEVPARAAATLRLIGVAHASALHAGLRHGGVHHHS